MFVIFSNFIPGAHGAGEAVEVVGVVLGPPHNVGREDARAAAAAWTFTFRNDLCRRRCREKTAQRR